MTKTNTSRGRIGLRTAVALVLVAVPVAAFALFGSRTPSAWGARGPFRVLDRAAFSAISRGAAPAEAGPAEVEVSRWEETDEGSKHKF